MPDNSESPFFSKPKFEEPKKPEDLSDSEWEKMLKNMSKGNPPTRPVLTEEEKKRLIRLAELEQFNKMKKAGIDDPKKLPGEIDGP